jgi:hypothetical protein
MKVPTTGTSVFAANLAANGTSAPITWNTNSTVDAVLTKRNLDSSNGIPTFVDRLRGNPRTLATSNTGTEGNNANITDLTISNGYIQKIVSTGGAGDALTYAFTRAPGFFDEVCYTGDSTARTLSHNLTVVPELMIVKNRTNNNGNQNWQVYSSALGNTSRLQLNTTDSIFTGTSIWNSTTPTSSVFSLGTSALVNGSGDTYVAYLFATCAGVSKVGSYTGSGGTQTINCGFTGGARFVLIKRTDSTGDWWVWDTTRGMVSGTDPRVTLNSEAAQINNNWVLTSSTGFQIVTSDASVNASGGTYIFLAIA